MGMRDIMTRLREEDPDMARWIQRIRFWTTAIAVVAALALIAAVGSNVWNFGQDQHITNVHNEVTKFEKSSCAAAQANPTDRAAVHDCQLVRAAAERTANENVNCIPFLRAGYVCPKPGSPLAEERRAREIREAVGAHGDPSEPTAPAPPATEGGDATSAPTDSSQPGRHGGGAGDTRGTQDGHEPGMGGSGGAPLPGEHGSGSEDLSPPTPPASTSESATSTGAQTTERVTEVVHEPSPPSLPAPERAAAPVREAAGTVVGEFGGTVNGTVEGMTGKTCELTVLLCE